MRALPLVTEESDNPKLGMGGPQEPVLQGKINNWQDEGTKISMKSSIEHSLSPPGEHVVTPKMEHSLKSPGEHSFISLDEHSLQ